MNLECNYERCRLFNKEHSFYFIEEQKLESKENTALAPHGILYLLYKLKNARQRIMYVVL